MAIGDGDGDGDGRKGGRNCLLMFYLGEKGGCACWTCGEYVVKESAQEHRFNPLSGRVRGFRQFSGGWGRSAFSYAVA